MPVIVPKERQINGLVYGSTEWHEVMKWVAPNNEWLQDAHMKWVVENDFPWPWNLMTERDVDIYRKNYKAIIDERNKKRMNIINDSMIPYKNALWDSVNVLFGNKDVSQKKNYIAYGNKSQHFTGKTYACSAFVIEMYDKFSMNSLYVDAQDLQDLCQKQSCIREELIEDLAKNVGCLVVDDLGEEKCGYNRNYVLNLINWRLKNNKQVFITTSLTTEQFVAYSERLLAWTKESSFFEMLVVDTPKR